ncbi:MAG: DUF1385 domain-containing protein [Candidatus Woesearchaeota archaeon]
MQQVGGQAVIEGVMMRNKEKYAVAVRLPNGKIKIKKEASSKYPKYFDFYFIRGVVGLGYSLYDGIRALIWSSNQNLGQEEKMSTGEVVLMLLTSLFFAVGFFVALPFFTANWISSEGVWFNVLDGLFRIGLFLIYLWAISRMSEVKRLFQYHGAEHKCIACHEAKKELTVKNVKPYSRFHPRCGTSFIFVVLLLSIIMFSFITGAWYVKFLGRILLLPVIAGIGYELIKLSSKYQSNLFVRIFIAPGLWLQRLTTGEPDDKQIEVGIAALKGVLK